MSVYIYAPCGDGGFFADGVHVSDRPTHSKLLDANGLPLKYDNPPKSGLT